MGLSPLPGKVFLNSVKMVERFVVSFLKSQSPSGESVPKQEMLSACANTVNRSQSPSRESVPKQDTEKRKEFA